MNTDMHTTTDADTLANLIVQSLNDGVVDGLAAPVERLVALDGQAERAIVLQAIVYMKQGRLDEAEAVLLAFCAQHGETGIVLTNLAKIHAERGDDTQALDTLWRALQQDPNQENGLGWYEAIHHDVGGDAAGIMAMRKVAALPHSWRAQLWLALGELGSHNYAGATALYRQALSHAGQPAPAVLLQQMGQDLGNAGRYQDVLDLIGPTYVPHVHGLAVGAVLIQAHLRLDQADAAARLLDALRALNRRDWATHLDGWASELARPRESPRT